MPPRNKSKGRGGNGARGYSRPVGSTVAAVDGRMPELQGRRFYQLLSALALIALPKLNAKRQQIGEIDWHPDMAANSVEAREIVLSYILQDINWLVDEVDSGRHDSLFRRLLGRRLTEGDKKEIRSWKLHIEDDFFVVDHKSGQGAVFVQVGRLQHHDFHKDEAPYLIEGEIHEPRCFVVLGLADPIKTLLAPVVQRFQQEHPSLQLAYPEMTNMCMIRTALLPYNGGITYMTLVSAPHGNHYATPQDMAAATQVAVNAYKAAFEEETAVALYRKLDPVEDASICRLASDPVNQGLPTSLRRLDQIQEHKNRRQEPGTTSIIINQIFWTPHHDMNHPQFESMMARATGGPKPFRIEGMKRGVTEEILVEDEDPCPFHKRFGEENASFADCCKRTYMERMLKAKRKGNAMQGHIVYNPVDSADIAQLDEHARPNRNPGFNIMPHIRIGYQDFGTINLRVSTSYVSLIKQRMDTCDLFHSSMEYKWIFWGYLPLCMQEIGAMTFGDITLDPRTGVFEGEAMTGARIASMITEMKHICTGIPILEASLEMQPSPGVRPDRESLEKNKALLQEGLQLDVSSKIDKKANESMRVRCAFCGATNGDDVALMRCPCKAVFYCCKAHQKAHWKDHKERCNRLRGV